MTLEDVNETNLWKLVIYLIKRAKMNKTVSIKSFLNSMRIFIIVKSLLYFVTKAKIFHFVYVRNSEISTNDFNILQVLQNIFRWHGSTLSIHPFHADYCTKRGDVVTIYLSEGCMLHYWIKCVIPETGDWMANIHDRTFKLYCRFS